MKQFDHVQNVKERLQLSASLLEYGRGPSTDLRKVEELVNEMMMWDACVIMKDDLRTVVPKEAASKILSGQARYSVLDESGIRFFEPKERRMPKSFSEESSTVCYATHAHRCIPLRLFIKNYYNYTETDA
jgi:hypothetical protein